MSTIRYRVSLASLHAHLFTIECAIPSPSADGQVFSLPAWVPGSYLVRDFARHVVNMAAQCQGKTVEVRKRDKHTWQCAPCSGELVLRYQVYAYDLSVRTAYLDHQRAYFNGSSLFMRIAGQEEAPHEVTIEAPGKPHERWQVATAMPAVETDASGFGRYQAANYEALIDYPVEIGDLAIAEFTAAGVPHRLIVSGQHHADLKRISRDLRKLCEWHIAFFGKAPFDRYDFMLYAAGDDQYGGLEHSNSTSLICPRSWLPARGEDLDREHYHDFLGLCSHEYFHAWHVKRIRPQAFVGADLGREAYTRLLWVFEGFTAYYDTLALAKCGLMSREEYLKDLGKTLTRYLRIPGRHVQPVEESSFDTWIKLYKPDENTPNAQVSYYLKGSLVALALDLHLRNSGSSLDAVMQGLWRDYAEQGQAVTEDEFAARVLRYTGQDIQPWLDAWVCGTEDPPFEKLLAAFGIQLEIADDRKGVRAAWGLQLAGDADTRIAHVFAASPAEKAGLAAHDVIIAVDGLKTTAKQLNTLLDKKADGSRSQVHFFRRDMLLSTYVIKQHQPVPTCTLKLENATPLLEAWLPSHA